MGSEERERVVFEFDGFRADPVRRVLSHQGEPVAITPKALSILLVLLDKAGEVVEKKELIERVWPGTFVSEANLTQNVFSLRKNLAERVPDVRYIVTVPGQGYSFVAEVRRLERQSTAEFPIVVEPPPPPAAAAEAPAEPEPPASGEPPAVAAPPPAARPRRVSSLGSASVLLSLVALGAVLFGLLDAARRPPPPTAPSAAAAPARRAIAVLDFKSLAPGKERRWLDTALAEMLTTELATGGAMRVIRGETVAQTAASLSLHDRGSLGLAELQRLHEALGADLVVAGSYLPIGDEIRLDLRVLRAPAGETVASFAQVGTEPELFDLVAAAGRELRTQLHIPEPSPEQFQETLALRPANPEARRLYAEGLKRLRSFDPPGAVDFLQRAAAADPQSAVIHSALAQSWAVLGYDPRAVAEASKARDLAGGLPQEDRLAIEARYYKAAKDWERAGQTYRSLWTFFPDEVDYGLQLAESLLMGGHGAEAAEALAALRQLPPPAGDDPRIDLVEARNALRLADFATELRAAEAAAAKGRRSGQTLVVAQALVHQGQALMRMGRTQQAVGLFRESAALFQKAGYQWGVGMAEANVATGLQALGDLDGAQQANEESLAIARRLGSAIGMASQYYNLGALHRDRGELAEALPLLEQARQWNLRMGDRLMEARALNATGSVLRARGDLKGARQRFERALELTQAVGNPGEEAVTVDNLGSLLAVRGELAEARRQHGQAFDMLMQAGDSSQAAAALASWAEAVARLGDLSTAWRRSAQALAAKQRAGDRIGAGQILGLRAWLAYEMGNLAASRSLAQEQLRLGRETGARSLEVQALQNLGRVDFAAGDLAAARRSFERSLRTSAALGERLRATEVRLELAGLALAEERSGAAADLAREAAAWYQGRELRDGEARALALLAEALLDRGPGDEAREAASAALAGFARSEDRQLRITIAVHLARVDAALGRTEESRVLLRHAAEDAERSGFAAAGLEARLALAEAQSRLRDPAAETTLAAVRKEALERGFKRLAARAAPPPRQAPVSSAPSPGRGLRTARAG